MAAMRCKPAMDLYKNLDDEQRNTIACLEFHSPSDADKTTVVFFADPSVTADMMEYGLWAATLSRVASGEHPHFDADGNIR